MEDYVLVLVEEDWSNYQALVHASARTPSFFKRPKPHSSGGPPLFPQLPFRFAEEKRQRAVAKEKADAEAAKLLLRKQELARQKEVAVRHLVVCDGQGCCSMGVSVWVVVSCGLRCA